MKLHGGGLSIESELGRGTTATVEFPANRVIAELAAERPEKEEIAQREIAEDSAAESE